MAALGTTEGDDSDESADDYEEFERLIPQSARRHHQQPREAKLTWQSKCRTFKLFLPVGFLLLAVGTRIGLGQEAFREADYHSKEEQKHVGIPEKSEQKHGNYDLVLKPSSINFTALVRELNLPRIFNQRFMNYTSSIPPWCTYDRAHIRSTGVQNNRRPYQSGLLYNKIPKAASSTTSGINLRISHNVAARYSASHRCTSYEHHIQRAGLVKRAFGLRERDKSFLYSSVRDPASQAISHIFFSAISRNGIEPTDDNIMKLLHRVGHQAGPLSNGQGGFQVEYLTEYPIAPGSAWQNATPNQVIDPDAVHRNVKRILDDYDFFISVERFDESIVVMQLLLGLEASDILYLSSKKSGTSYSPSIDKSKCFLLQTPFTSTAVAKHLASDEWYAKQYGDYVLVETVRQSLDLTIQALGEDKFQQAMDTFLKLKEQATEACSDAADFLCSDEGVVQLSLAKESCYEKDWGCGYKCLDNFTA
eukprot:scaffold2177_cov115-Cylindrotheca_fusiformis.AAC.4